MKKTFILTLLIGISSFLFSQTQTEMNISSSEELKKADSELNQVYKKILIEYASDIAFIQKLKIAQRLWIKYRDAELDMKFPESDKQTHYGSMYPLCMNSYLKKLTKERTKKLREWLEPLPDGEGCRGSIKER